MPLEVSPCPRAESTIHRSVAMTARTRNRYALLSPVQRRNNDECAESFQSDYPRGKAGFKTDSMTTATRSLGRSDAASRQSLSLFGLCRAQNGGAGSHYLVSPSTTPQTAWACSATTAVHAAATIHRTVHTVVSTCPHAHLCRGNKQCESALFGATILSSAGVGKYTGLEDASDAEAADH